MHQRWIALALLAFGPAARADLLFHSSFDPPACAAGRFVLPDSGTGIVRSVYFDGSRRLDLPGCPPLSAEVTVAGDTVSVQTQAPMGVCPEYEGLVSFSGEFDRQCATLVGTLVADGVQLTWLGEATPRLSVTRDQGRQARRTLDREGGTLSVVDEHGIAYALTVPPDALLGATQITMTAAAIAPFDGSGYGIDLAPDGLDLLQPAELEITLPVGIDATSLMSIGWQTQGTDLHLRPRLVLGQTLTTWVSHFSGYGLMPTVPENLQIIIGGPTSSLERRYANQLVGLLPSNDPLDYVFVLRRWYEELRPILSAALTDDVFRTEAVQQYLAWQGAVITTHLMVGVERAEIVDPLAALLADAKTAMRDALIAGFERNSQACLDGDSLARAEDALRWRAIADAMGIVNYGSNIDPFEIPLTLQWARNNLCLRPVVKLDYPERPRPGEAGPLTINAGWVFSDAPDIVLHEPPVQFTVFAVGAQEGDAVGTIDRDEPTVIPYTPVGDRTLEINVDATLTNPPSFERLSDLIGNNAVFRGLRIEPRDTTVGPGTPVPVAVYLWDEERSDIPIQTDAGAFDTGGLIARDESGVYELSAELDGFFDVTDLTVSTVYHADCGLNAWDYGSASQGDGNNGGSNQERLRVHFGAREPDAETGEPIREFLEHRHVADLTPGSAVASFDLSHQIRRPSRTSIFVRGFRDNRNRSVFQRPC